MVGNMNVEDTDSEIDESWEIGCTSLVNEKSKERYEKAYASFKYWLVSHEGVINDKTLLAYFVKRCQKFKSPGSLWSEYSMLKTMINLNHNINIGEFYGLLSFLKKKNVGHVAKRSKVFSREDMNRFLIEAPDERYLMMKVAMIIGIAGACRRDELTNLTINDIEDRGSVIVVNIPSTKNNLGRTFTVTDKPDEDVSVLEIFRKYVHLRPINPASHRFFYRLRHGKCINQVVGINAIGRVASNIAKFLHLKDPHSYTGHTFRRTSAMLSANTGDDICGLKRLSDWKSNSMAEEYMEDSIHNKMQCTDNSNTSMVTYNCGSTSPETAIMSTSRGVSKSDPRAASLRPYETFTTVHIERRIEQSPSMSQTQDTYFSSAQGPSTSCAQYSSTSQVPGPSTSRTMPEAIPSTSQKADDKDSTPMDCEVKKEPLSELEIEEQKPPANCCMDSDIKSEHEELSEDSHPTEFVTVKSEPFE